MISIVLNDFSVNFFAQFSQIRCFVILEKYFVDFLDGYKSRNGSLFTYLTATVTVNGLENEMSSELRFQGRKWGGRKQGNP